MKKVEELTAEELEALLEKKRKQERQRLLREQKAYEEARDKAIEEAVTERKKLQELVRANNKHLHELMEKQQEKLNEYGRIRKNSKGGFSITHSNNQMRITRTRSTQPTWDERSQKAVELIKDFLIDTVKKRDQKTFTLLMEFIAKNEKGDLEYSKVMNLLHNEELYDDPRWKEGLRLIRESFSNDFKGFGYEVKVKDEKGKWKPIHINETI